MPSPSQQEHRFAASPKSGSQNQSDIIAAAGLLEELVIRWT
jgi:hypothetical protein